MAEQAAFKGHLLVAAHVEEHFRRSKCEGASSIHFCDGGLQHLGQPQIPDLGHSAVPIQQNVAACQVPMQALQSTNIC